MTAEHWENNLNRVGAVLNFGIDKKEKVQNSKMARLVAATPYLAGCNKRTETSFSHLLIFLMSLEESAKDVYLHKPEDDDSIYTRLFPISNFSEGNKTIIQCCLDLMALCMVSNYKNNSEEDSAIGKYNPINAGKWDYNSISSTLINNIDKTITSEITDIYTKEEALKGYWE